MTDNTMTKRKKDKCDKQRPTKHTHKTKDRVTRIPLKLGVNSGAPEGQKDKKTNNDLQNNTQKTKDRATRTPLETRG